MFCSNEDSFAADTVHVDACQFRDLKPAVVEPHFLKRDVGYALLLLLRWSPGSGVGFELGLGVVLKSQFRLVEGDAGVTAHEKDGSGVLGAPTSLPTPVATAALNHSEEVPYKCKSEREWKRLDLTIKEEDIGHGLLHFFSPTSHEEYQVQLAAEYERMTERQEELRLLVRRAAIRKVEHAHM
ncbi:uncharacterized protein EI90DRAFT_3020049 [Cantharellus anzutake]|uniref:uncharacterized protein n=1 Tax=Cantharellus anzutake TaxID=1750568 RepID=UPI00190402CC|nr:uncharacterized protein EI90DRAFT_3020049 [Cantharellus anzutake]KAF8322786.1 hypothetical protein EI90DRAFT_3020049 [Cantharellus anzutake]